jgi:hypothetical protein
MDEYRLISRSSLAAIEAAISEMLTETKMTNLLEQFGFACQPRAKFGNKLQKARAYLGNADWNDPEALERLLDMLSHQFGLSASHRDYRVRSDLDGCPLAQ